MNHESHRKHERGEEAAHRDGSPYLGEGSAASVGKEWKRKRLTGDGSPYLVEMHVVGRDERPRSSAVGPGGCWCMGQWRMAEATPSGRGRFAPFCGFCRCIFRYWRTKALLDHYRVPSNSARNCALMWANWVGLKRQDAVYWISLSSAV